VVCLAVLAVCRPGWAEEGNFSATENESGAFKHQFDASAGKAKKDSGAKAAKAAKPVKKGKALPPAEDKALAEMDSSGAGGEAETVADSGLVEAAETGSGGKGDSAAAEDSGSAAKESMGGDSLAVAPARLEEMKPPTLVLLPMAVLKGTEGGEGDFGKVEAALRLGFAQSKRFRVWTEEQAEQRRGHGEAPSRECFSEACVAAAAHAAGSAFVVASQYSSRDSVRLLKLVLMDSAEGRIRKAVQIWGRPGRDGLIPFAREAAFRLALPESGNDSSKANEEARIDGSFYATRPWPNIPWLNPKDTLDNRRRWSWAGSGLLAAGIALAYAQGQLLLEDGNGASPARNLLSGDGAQSFLRGFFAAPTLGARYAAMGGAGIAHVDNGLAPLMNPAGVADADHENVIAAKRNLPDGTPSFFLGYAGPLFGHWSQGLGFQFEGDRLANETTLDGTLGYDLGALSKALAGFKVGAQTKLYLARVGEAGTGEDRSTGHSFGMGLDLGLRARLNDKITAALTVRDAAGFLRHTNTFTDRSYAEVLPTEYRVGASYQAAPSLLLLMDGQKGVWADQADHLRLGGEQILFDFLSLRCGLHEIFGRESVRKISAGFGLDSGGLTDKSLKMNIAINYAYEFGVGEDEPLGAGQQFSLEASF
jgi:hypothetical protein